MASGRVNLVKKCVIFYSVSQFSIDEELLRRFKDIPIQFPVLSSASKISHEFIPFSSHCFAPPLPLPPLSSSSLLSPLRLHHCLWDMLLLSLAVRFSACLCSRPPSPPALLNSALLMFQGLRPLRFLLEQLPAVRPDGSMAAHYSDWFPVLVHQLTPVGSESISVMWTLKFTLYSSRTDRLRF